jgi:hypothetical protein
MKPIRRPRICVEPLEARDCPAFSISLSGGNLFITGLPTPNSATGVLVKQTANNTFNVSNNAVNLGTYVASNVTLNLFNHTGSPVNFDLGGFTASGNISINLGNGDPSGTASVGTGVSNGTLAGNLSIRGGHGTEYVLLGYKTAGLIPQPNPLNIRGNVTMQAAVNPTNPNPDVFDTGVVPGTPPLTKAINIGGSVTTTAVNGIGINSLVTIGGNLNVNGGGDILNIVAGGFFAGGLFDFGKVLGNVTVVGSQSSSSDQVFLTQGAGQSATVGGNVSINLGNGSNQVWLGGTIGGSIAITSGNGTPNAAAGQLGTVVTGVDPAAFQVNNSLNVNLGNGNNTFFDAKTKGAGISANTFVNGDLNLRAGNGANSLGTIASTEFGNLNVNLGNGANTPVRLTGAVFGNVNWTSGNGPNNLTIPAPAAGSTTYNANVLFGNADDTFTLGGDGGAGATVTLTGSVNGGGHLAGNVFNQLLGGILGGNFTLSNFP